jgi:hypothetical protein
MRSTIATPSYALAAGYGWMLVTAADERCRRAAHMV